ncbi:MAG: OmpA family protein [Saprospiraceae bacterium]|nr:OmpA family protein [Saprospiraceae bacterium]MBK8775943.1 OmpA family protein [Saprospiraceae bacterium]MBK9678169.1 OmpA family protein [Saprospiraceae bacterium]MBP7924230.1 OmpA family protein [Saprospiraceae bacterium]MBP8094216.1 OmpA family protein [Saprospiraceae bacterium]
MGIRLVFIMMIIAPAARGQIKNLVPNAGFEKIIGAPERWFYTGQDFDLVFSDWKSPTAASPDVYHQEIPVPIYWREMGFTAVFPFRGKSMVGLTLYGCNQGKLHCREYVTAPLIDSLVIGQEYELTMWLAPMPGGHYIDKLQVAMDKHPAQVIDDRLLDLKPFYDLPIRQIKGWQKVILSFFAETEASYLTLGNFRSDAHTLAQKMSADSSKPYAYYYIDEVSLKKIPPILDREDIESYDSIQLEEASIELKNIYFDFDETRLLPASFQELNRLLAFLTDHPSVHINVIGHTDNTGSSEYNQTLSTHRANAVADFLTRHYIDPSRIKTKGYGYDVPIASNQDEVGRQKNRRVVFEIIR